VTFALSFNDHLLELLAGSDIFGMLRLGNDQRNLPFSPIFRHRGPGRFLRSRCFRDEDGFAFIGDASRRLTCRGADQRSEDKESLYCPACEERIHKVFCQWRVMGGLAG
jgi:hypothetical protein